MQWLNQNVERNSIIKEFVLLIIAKKQSTPNSNIDLYQRIKKKQQYYFQIVFKKKHNPSFFLNNTKVPFTVL